MKIYLYVLMILWPLFLQDSSLSRKPDASLEILSKLNSIDSELLSLHEEKLNYTKKESKENPSVLPGSTLARIRQLQEELFNLGFFVAWRRESKAYRLVSTKKVGRYVLSFAEIDGEGLGRGKLQYGYSGPNWYVTHSARVVTSFKIHRETLIISKLKNQSCDTNRACHE